MNATRLDRRALHRGVGLIEVMISIVISMLLVLVIYQVYELSEGQKRTITAGSDAQQNASYGTHVLARDLAIAGNGIASSATAMLQCSFDAVNPGPWVLPVPVVINTGASANDPDAITVLYGGSSSLSTPVQFKQTATTADPYVVQAPVGFSQNDVIVAVQGTNCTVSTINGAAGSVVVSPTTGFATIAQTPAPGSPAATYSAVTALLINLGQASSMGRIAYTVDPSTTALRVQNLLPTAGQVTPIISDVVNLKAQYGIGTDTDGDGVPDTITSWEDSNGAWWQGFLALAPTDPNRLTQLRRLMAVRIAIVTRSTQMEFDPTTKLCSVLTAGPIQMFDDTVSMTLNSDQKCYRYRVLETVVPLRNALWNLS